MSPQTRVTKSQFITALEEAHGDVLAAGEMVGISRRSGRRWLASLPDGEIPDVVLWCALGKQGVGVRKTLPGRNRSVRNQIISRHLPLVSAIARTIALKLHPRPSYTAMIAMGQHGLLDAIGRYDHTRDVKFAAYAYSRIRGAIYDGLDKTSQEQSGSLPDVPAKPDAEQVQCEAEISIAHVTLGLPIDEWLVVYLHYAQGAKLKQVAEAMSLSESRCRQLRGTALDWLREHKTREELLEVLT